MYPANNPDYAFPWGLPPPNQNVNPFANNFGAGTHASNANEDFTFQQRTNTWSPSPWNDNYNPQPQANRWNQWIPSPQPSAAIPPEPQPQPLLPSFDLRQRLLMKRQQRSDVHEPTINSATTSQKPQPRPHVPTTASSLTLQPKQHVPTDTTIKVSVLRNYAIPAGNNIPSKNRKVRLHFQVFKKLLQQFMVNPSSSIFGGLVKELVMCSKNVTYIKEIENFIHEKLSVDAKPWMAPHLKMRVFWLLGEIFRPEYDRYFGEVRQILNADELFQEFLRTYTVEICFTDELQAIWYYWKSYVHENVMDRMAKNCNSSNRKILVNSMPDNSMLRQNYAKIFGNATVTHTSDVQRPQKPIPIVFDINNASRAVKKMIPQAPKKKVTNDNLVPLDQKRIETTQLERNQVVTHNYSWPAKFSLPSATSVTPAKPKPVSHVKPEESKNFDIKTAKLLSLLDKLVTVDRTDAPKAASELLYCFLEHGSHHQLSDMIVKETTKRLQQICNNSNIIRILWVIGYLFFPKYESKLTTLKPLMEKIAARLFWICLIKTHKDTSIREEMRVILKLWREIVHDEITSSIMARIKDTIASDHEVNLNWILNDKNIRKGTRIVEFYNNKYLINASTAGPKSKAMKNQGKEKKTTSEDSDDDIIILDKCDIIQSSTSNPQNKLAVKHKSDDSLDARHKLKKRTKVTEEEDKIFIEFHRIPSKPVNLVKPVSRKEATTNDSSNFKNYEIGYNYISNNSGSSGSGNQEQQQLSKLELFRKKMEKDAAMASIGGGHRWNDTSLRENKEIYLRQEWTVDEFVYCVCSEEFQTSWDIVKLNGQLRVKIVRK